MFEAERTFITSARRGLSAARNAVADHEFDVAAQALPEVIARAYDVRAKAIAFCFEHALTSAQTQDDALALSHLGSAARLIEQFAAGLAEIDTPEAIAIYRSGLTPADSQKPRVLAELDVTAPDLTAAGLEEFDVKQAAQQAAHTLSSLLPHSRPEERQALSALMGQNGQTDLNEAPGAPVTMQDSLDNSASKPPADIPLEQAMVPLTNNVLGHAWRSGQRVSLSYNCADAQIKAPALHAIAQYLTHVICERLTPKTSDAKPAHIALSAQMKNRDVVITLENNSGTSTLDDDDENLDPVIISDYRVTHLREGSALHLTLSRREDLSLAAEPEAQIEDPGNYLSEALV